MKQKVSVLLVLMVIFISICVCESNKKSKNVSVTVDNNNIECYRVNDSDHEFNTHIFEDKFEKGNDDNIEYIDIGKKVVLDFGDRIPEKVVVYDHLLNSEGKIMYTEKEISEVTVTEENNKYYFEVPYNMASLLSSYYEENKKDFRGFKVIASWSWGDTEELYAFVIKSDAY